MGPDLTIGSVVNMTSCTAVFDTPNGPFRVSYKAEKGKRFSFLLLGVDSKEAPIDPMKVLRAFEIDPT